jgi:ribosomal-protein-alanine N-acetyltransferase
MAAPPVGAAADGLGFGPADASDLDALVSIDADSPRAWNREAFSRELENDPGTLFALRSADEVVGFAVVRWIVPDLDIVNLAVASERRGRGLGARLLSFLLDHASAIGVKSVFLEVREGNQEARKLYGNAGFTETQRRPGFYLNPIEDAILMRREMSDEQG